MLSQSKTTSSTWSPLENYIFWVTVTLMPQLSSYENLFFFSFCKGTAQDKSAQTSGLFRRTFSSSHLSCGWRGNPQHLSKTWKHWADVPRWMSRPEKAEAPAWVVYYYSRGKNLKQTPMLLRKQAGAMHSPATFTELAAEPLSFPGVCRGSGVHTEP